jgi:uncharacterized protein YkwD
MLRKSLWLWICAAMVGLYSCQKQDLTAKVLPTDDSSGVSGNNVNQATLLQLVNNVRQSGCTCGSTIMPPVSAITWNIRLETAAFNHSNDMYINDYFNHVGLNGSSAGERITAAGYIWITYGENIAKGYTSEQSVVAGWINSEGHCKNIMNASFREMGVGRAGSYWTQEFGTR